MIRAELFLPQELSNFLISKGFDWEVVGIYSTDDKIMLAGATAGFKNEHYYYEKHGAILWDQAEAWLRNVKGLSAEVSSFNEKNGDNVPIYQWEIRRDGAQYIMPCNMYNSHRKARIDGMVTGWSSILPVLLLVRTRYNLASSTILFISSQSLSIY